MSALGAAVESEQRYRKRVADLAAGMISKGLKDVEVAAVLGSGLGAFADRLIDPLRVPYSEFPQLPRSTVPGHAGEFVLGELPDPAGGAPVRVLLMAGRVHLYEGWSAREVTLAMRALPQLGARAVLLTNAAGGMSTGLGPGTLMRITDHLNRQGQTPLFFGEHGAGEIYDEALGELLQAAADEQSVPLLSGVYAGLPGPTYESPAEIRFLARWGADAVGMSTVLEALAARAAGCRVCAISCITNLAAGISPTPLDHQEVIEAGRAAAESFGRLLEAALPKVARG